MADFTALKTAIQTYIKQNGNEEITGEKLQEILLSVVTTLGDSAINDLVTALATEVAARQNADGTLQQNITNEATARGNADTALSNRLGSTITAENTAADQIGAEAEARAAADTALQGLIDGITDNIENGYVYAGIATPSSTPATGKVFYLALTAGTYTNFGNTEVSQGINILKYNGSAWSLDAFIGIDDELTPGSNKLPKSGNVLENIIKNGSAFDLSAYNAVDGVLVTYADLDAALTALNLLPAVYKQGGMSFKFVLTSDNNYVQLRLMADTFTTDITKWQGVDDEPTEGSKNLIESQGVYNKIAKTTLGVSASAICHSSVKECNIDGYYVNRNDGSINPIQDWNASDFIDISGVKDYLCYYSNTGGGTNSYGVAFYDSNKDYLGGSNYLTTIGTQINVPFDAHYMRYCCYKNTVVQFYFNKISDYVDAKSITSNLYLGSIQIDSIEKTARIAASYYIYKNGGSIAVNEQQIAFDKGSLGSDSIIFYLDEFGTFKVSTLGSGNYRYVKRATDNILAVIRFNGNNVLYVQSNSVSFIINGIEYCSAQAVKSIENIKGEINDFKFEKYTFSDYLIDGYYIANPENPSFGQYVENQPAFAYIPSQIRLNRGDTFIISGTSGIANARAYFLTTLDGEFIESSEAGIVLSNYTKTVNQDCYLYVSTNATNTAASLSILRQGKTEEYIHADLDIKTGCQIDNNGDVVSDLDSHYAISKPLFIFNDRDIKISDCFGDSQYDNVCVSFFDATKQFVSNIKVSGRANFYIKREDVPTGAVYFIVNINNWGIYTPEVNYISRSYLYNERKSILNFGKKIAVFGGSHSVREESREAKKHWRQNLLCDVYTYSWGGAGFIYAQTLNQNIQKQVDDALASGIMHDIYIFWGSTNDCTHDVEPGSPTDYTVHDNYDSSKIVTKTDSSISTGTLCGGFNACIKKILTANPKAIIYILLPLRFFDRDYGYDPYSVGTNGVGKRFTDYVNALKELGEYNNIKVFDQWELMSINSFNYTDFYISDNLHLNEMAYDRLGYAQAQFLKNGI